MSLRMTKEQFITSKKSDGYTLVHSFVNEYDEDVVILSIPWEGAKTYWMAISGEDWKMHSLVEVNGRLVKAEISMMTAEEEEKIRGVIKKDKPKKEESVEEPVTATGSPFMGLGHTPHTHTAVAYPPGAPRPGLTLSEMQRLMKEMEDSVRMRKELEERERRRREAEATHYKTMTEAVYESYVPKIKDSLAKESVLLDMLRGKGT